MTDPLKVRFKFLQMVKIFFSGSMLILLCLVLFSFGFIEDHKALIFIQIFAVIGLLFFVPIMFFLFIAFITKRPALIISEEGLIDQSQLYGVGLIKWDDIETITIGEKFGISFLTIDTYNPDLLINRTKGIKRIYLHLNEFLANTAGQIDISRLAITEQELIKSFQFFSNGRFNAENITETNTEKWRI